MNGVSRRASRHPAVAWIAALPLSAAPAAAQVIDGYAPKQANPSDTTWSKTPKPAYPLESRRRREQVIGALRVFVTPTGALDRVEVARYTGSLFLMNYARDFARRSWRFEARPVPPGSKGLWKDVPISFVIDDGGVLLRYVEKIRGPNHPDAKTLRAMPAFPQ